MLKKDFQLHFCHLSAQFPIKPAAAEAAELEVMETPSLNLICGFLKRQNILLERILKNKHLMSVTSLVSSAYFLTENTGRQEVSLFMQFMQFLVINIYNILQVDLKPCPC